MQDAISKVDCHAKASTGYGVVPDGLKRDTLDKTRDEDPDVACHDDAKNNVVGDAHGPMDQDAHVENKDGDLGEGEAHGIEDEADPLFLRAVSRAALMH